MNDSNKIVDNNNRIDSHNNKNANKYSEEILLKIKQPYSNHIGGCITFGSDDFLYIAMGDGGSSGDPENRSQDNTNLFGTILR